MLHVQYTKSVISKHTILSMFSSAHSICSIHINPSRAGYPYSFFRFINSYDIFCYHFNLIGTAASWWRDLCAPALAKLLSGDDRNDEEGDDGSLTSEGDGRAVVHDPVSLEIDDTETANSSERIDPSTSQSSLLREDVEQIGRDCNSGTEGAEAVQAPTKGQADPVILVLERFPEDDESKNTKDPCRIHTPETVLRFVCATVGANVSVAKEVIEPVAPELGAHGTNHRCQEEKRHSRWRERIRTHTLRWWGKEEGDGADNANGPHGDPGNEAEG